MTDIIGGNYFNGVMTTMDAKYNYEEASGGTRAPPLAAAPAPSEAKTIIF